MAEPQEKKVVEDNTKDDNDGEEPTNPPDDDSHEVDIATPEGEELLLTAGRAKLYRFMKDKTGSGEWKERGIGLVSFFRYKDSGKVHSVMRREKTHKVCMNHYITDNLNLQPNSGSDKSWVWTTADFADGEMKVEVFAIKFRTKEDAVQFFDAYKQYASPPQSKSDESTTPAQTSTPAATEVS
eukprot:c10779_g1_i1.p1 GENE.c10779_g1_i1~~c10779_g1_i1.p1  ORF type:complete len:194 (+),score=48.76 c10779_g1_i1:34-582(+)